VDDRAFFKRFDSLRRRTGSGFQTIVAFAIYAAVSGLFFGRPILGHLSQYYIGIGTDPICHIWAFAWWPYAIAHRINPLITHALWAPVGYNLVWGTGVPGPSLLAYPITKIFGPVVSYNLICLIALPAASASAFLLCRYLCGQFWPALFGGYIFGFSPYMLCHLLGHLVLIVIFLVPLAVYVTLLRLAGSMQQRGFVVSLTTILLFQFLSSTEICATATVFGAIALMLGLLIAEKATRLNIIAVTKEILCAYAVVTILMVPYLYYVFVPGLPITPNSSTAYSNDLLSFVLPPPVLLVGLHAGSSLPRVFFSTTPWWEQAGYLGPGLWILMGFFACSYWRTRIGKFLVLNFAVILIASVGPLLHADGKPLISMPWRLVNNLPLINDALPGRFGMYLFLATAVSAAVYVAHASFSTGCKVLLVVFSIAFIAPRPAIWRDAPIPPSLGKPGLTRIQTPEFFRFAQYRRILSRGDNVLFLPLGNGGSTTGMLWQAQSQFYFNTIDWFGSFAPPDSNRWPIMAAVHSGMKIVDFSEQLEGFLGAHQVKAVIVDASAQGRWPALLSEVGMTPVATGGVLFYKVPARVLLDFHDTTAHQMAEKEAAACFAALLTAAWKYLDRGFPLNKLALGEVQRLKLLNLPEGQAPSTIDSRWSQNVGLGNLSGLIGIGIAGDYQDLKFLITNYRSEAVNILFPFPTKFMGQPKQNTYGRLVIMFTPRGLEQAASKATIRERSFTNCPSSLRG
jgi:hypothetical protein